MASVNLRNRRKYVYTPFVAAPAAIGMNQVIQIGRRIGKSQTTRDFVSAYLEKFVRWKEIRTTLRRQPNNSSKRQLRTIRKQYPTQSPPCRESF